MQKFMFKETTYFIDKRGSWAKVTVTTFIQKHRKSHS